MEKTNPEIQKIFSIIIPHFNLHQKLRRLLLTLPHREDLEIIVIDDSSSTQKEELKKIQNDFENLQLFILPKNGGGGKARNKGLSLAKGKYIIFADADDFFLPSLENILDRCKNLEFDVLYFNAISLNEETFSISKREKYLSKNFSNLDNQAPNYYYFRYLFGEPWCKIINRKLIVEKNLKFDEIRIHNDTRFAYLVGFFAKQIILDSTVAYCVINRDDSVSKQLDEDKIETRIRVFSQKNKFLIDNKIPVFDPLILSPFISALKKFDIQRLKRYCKITNEVGLSTKVLIRKSIKYKIKKYLKKSNF